MPDFTIRGNPAGIRSRATTTVDKGQAFYDTGTALAKIDTSGWIGRAADHFRDAHDLEPERWTKAGNGFVRAGNALLAYAAAVERAQGIAEWASSEYERGNRVTEEARAAYDADVAAGERQRDASLAIGVPFTLTILPFDDPGEEIRRNAVSEFETAKAELETAAQTCAAEVRAGCRDAPEEPNWLESGLKFVGGIFEGAGEAIWDLVTLSPFSAINMVQDAWKLASGELTPEELAAKYRLSLETAQDMLRALQEDPIAFGRELGKGLLDWDTWADDPARAIGHLVPDLIAAVFTAGAGAVATRGVKGGGDALDALADLGRLDDVADLRRLEDLDELAGLNRLDDAADPLGAYADGPTPPQGTDRTLDDPDLDPWLDEMHERYPDLGRDDLRALWDYTTDDGYRTMNGELRSPGTGDAAQVARERVDATVQAMDRLPPYEGVTYRGTNLPDRVVDMLEQEGTYRDPGFSSSSLRQEVANGFYDPDRPNPTQITVQGHSGVNVQPFSAAQGEAEILFRPGTEFDVLSNVVDENGVRHLVLREKEAGGG